MKVLLLSAFLVATMAAASVHAQQPDLRLTLQLEKAQLNVGEPIMVRVLIENRSPVDLVINRRLLVNRPIGPHEIFFQITGPDGRQVPFEARIRESFESREFILLGTQRSYGKLYDLASEHEIKTPGEYSVVAFYENQQDAPAALSLSPAWKGRLQSQAVKFSLK